MKTQAQAILISYMRELLYSAGENYKRGKDLAERGNAKAALRAYSDAIKDLHAVKPQRMRDVLLAQVHLSRYQVALKNNDKRAIQDLRFGYSYARTTQEPKVRELAEQLWSEHLRGQIPVLAAND